MINVTRPVIGEELEDCQEESMTVVDTLMVEGEVEECDEVMESVCDTEYTQECDCSQSEQCEEVMVEVCAERRVRPEPSCVTLYIDDCQSRWEGEGDSRVWVN